MVFKPGQYDLLEGMISSTLTLGVHPTGGGKTIAFALAAKYHLAKFEADERDRARFTTKPPRRGVAMLVVPLRALAESLTKDLVAANFNAVAVGHVQKDLGLELNAIKGMYDIVVVVVNSALRSVAPRSKQRPLRHDLLRRGSYDRRRLLRSLRTGVRPTS